VISAEAELRVRVHTGEGRAQVKFGVKSYSCHFSLTARGDMHTSLAWVPRGRSAAHPRKYELDEAELERVSKLAKIRLEDAQFDLESAQAAEAAAQAGGDDDWEE
jgi:hypothetical protein